MASYLSYQRIITIDPTKFDEMMTNKKFGVVIRPAKNGGPNEYVVGSDDPHERRAVDKIVALFNVE